MPLVRKVCEVTKEKIKEYDEGRDEETNATEERGRRSTRAILGRGTRTFNAGLTPCSHTTTTKKYLMSTHPRESI